MERYEGGGGRLAPITAARYRGCAVSMLGSTGEGAWARGLLIGDCDTPPPSPSTLPSAPGSQVVGRAREGLAQLQPR